MAVGGQDALRTAKAALDEGLIDATDFNEVKVAFLRAQQIRAGLDAGFIREDDYQAVKKAFLHSLNMSVDPGAITSSLPPGGLNGSGGDSSLRPPSPGPPPLSGQPSRSASNLSLGRSLEQAPTPPMRAASPAPPAAEPPQPAQRLRLVPTNVPKIGGARPRQTGSTSMSGISVTEDAINLYYYLKAKSVYRWALWRINDAGNEVIICEAGDKASTYQDFLAALPPSDCRYGVIDMQFTNSEGCVFNKILFINWAPDSARIKAKMMYASTKDFFKGYLDGLSIELQGSDLDDISEAEANLAVRGSVTRQ